MTDTVARELSRTQPFSCSSNEDSTRNKQRPTRWVKHALTAGKTVSGCHRYSLKKG